MVKFGVIGYNYFIKYIIIFLLGIMIHLILRGDGLNIGNYDKYAHPSIYIKEDLSCGGKNTHIARRYGPFEVGWPTLNPFLDNCKIAEYVIGTGPTCGGKTEDCNNDGKDVWEYDENNLYGNYNETGKSCEPAGSQDSGCFTGHKQKCNCVVYKNQWPKISYPTGKPGKQMDVKCKECLYGFDSQGVNSNTKCVRNESICTADLSFLKIGKYCENRHSITVKFNGSCNEQNQSPVEEKKWYALYKAMIDFDIDPVNVTSLTIQPNSIKRLPNFKQCSLKHLEYLNISDNPLIELNLDLFHGYTKKTLKTLVFKNINCKYIPDLHDFEILESLFMSSNDLNTYLEQQIDFEEILPKSLTSLDLSNTKLNYLPDFTKLQKLNKLKNLDLSKNNIDKSKDNLRSLFELHCTGITHIFLDENEGALNFENEVLPCPTPQSGGVVEDNCSKCPIVKKMKEKCKNFSKI